MSLPPDFAETFAKRPSATWTDLFDWADMAGFGAINCIIPPATPAELAQALDAAIAVLQEAREAVLRT